MEDSRNISEFKFRNKEDIFIIVTEKERNVPQNVQPLVVGGIDLTDIPQFSGLLKKKNYDFVSSAGLANQVTGISSQGAPKMQQQRGEVDLKLKFGRQLQQIKEMGIDDEGRILQALLQTNGNLQLAIQKLMQ